MRESEFKLNIVRAIRNGGGYARRVEDKYTVGMPDLFLVPSFCPAMWVEAKIIDGNILSPTPRQYIELCKLWLPPYCYAFTIGWKDGDVYINIPQRSSHITKCLKQQANEPLTEFLRRAVHDHPQITRIDDVQAKASG